jgi:hypothetical protein
LSRVWKNKKGQELDSVWIADYESYNVDGVIILSKGKKTLHKIPISVLCDEDVKFIQERRLNADVSRFAYKTISIPEDTEIALQFNHVGKEDMKVEGVIFAKGNNTDGEKVQYIHLYPKGQICVLPIESEDISSNYKEQKSEEICLREISSEEASKGCVALLEKMISDEIVKDYTLPVLQYSNKSYEVQGVVVNLEKKSPQLICSLSQKGKKESGSMLTGNEGCQDIMLDLISVLEAKEYYNTHCGVIPLLGFCPSKVTHGEVSKDIKNIEFKLVADRKKARSQIKHMKKWHDRVGLPLECILDNYKIEKIGQISRQWIMKDGKKVKGVWVANFQINCIRGVVMYEMGSCKMKKIPLTDFSEKDQKIIKEMNTHVPRFECMRISIPEGSKLSYQCKCIGADIKNFDAIILGKEEKSGYERLKAGTESALYVQIFPDGQICKLELDDKMIKGNMFGQSLGEVKKYDDLEQVKRGPFYELAKRAREKLSSLISDEKYAEYAYEQSNPELSCEIHKWQEKYAPKYNGDYYTKQQKADYSRNYKLALLAQKDGKERCTCKDPNVESRHNKAKEAWIEACDKRRDFERRELIYKFINSENL